MRRMKRFSTGLSVLCVLGPSVLFLGLIRETLSFDANRQLPERDDSIDPLDDRIRPAMKRHPINNARKIDEAVSRIPAQSLLSRELDANLTQQSPSSTPVPQLRHNLVMIVLDQLRFDTLGYVQDQMQQYEGKLRIRTPNIDRLARSGAHFQTAYCQSLSCGPARASLKTGCTVARTGLNGNKLTETSVYTKMDMIEDKVKNLETFEQLLVDRFQYSAMTFGKWHVPKELYYSRSTQRPIIDSNHYDYRQSGLQFAPELLFKPFYLDSIEYFRESGVLPETNFTNGSQLNFYSNTPYLPVQLDSRYGMPTNTPISRSNNDDGVAGSGETRTDTDDGESSMVGRDLIDSNYTSTAVLTDMAMQGLNRMIDNYRDGENPFLLGVHYNSPHPPVIATSEWMDYYYNNRDQIFIPPSIKDSMHDSAYAFENQRNFKKKTGPYPYDDEDKIAELTAIYYGLIEEVDSYVGKIVRRIDEAGLRPDTIIVLTSDHGDMLGAHGMTGKGILLEEATRVPLIVSFPGRIRERTAVSEPASHLDLFATILDYLGVPDDLNGSDGQSLRRFIEGTSWNQWYDESTVVAELDRRIPDSKDTFTGSLGDIPNFMIRKGDLKLIVPRNRDSPVRDMMYDLSTDPFEMTNLLSDGASNEVIGKAEHLKALLVEWLRRKDTDRKLYSSNRWNLGEGRGDVAEVQNRRTWRELPYWQSGSVLEFGTPVLVDRTLYTRREFLYVGRTSEGTLNIDSIFLRGRDASYFSLSGRPGGRYRIHTNDVLRIGVTFQSQAPVRIADLEAEIVISNDVSGERVIRIIGVE